MGFTKLDEGLLKSSVMAEKPEVFKVWIALLAACKQDGIAEVSPVFLSAVCRLDQEVVNNAIRILESPDDLSRSKDEQGRRIRKVDGGFYIINYLKYRQYTYSDSPGAVRVRRHREKKDKEEFDEEFLKIWTAWPIDGRFHKQSCYNKYKAIVKEGQLEDLQQGVRGYFAYLKIKRVHQNFEQRALYLETFLNKQRFMEYKDFKYQPRL